MGLTKVETRLKIHREYPSKYQIQEFWLAFVKHNCKRVLDAGCGIGWFGKFRPARTKVYGIDYNFEEAKIASKHEISVVGDIRNLPYQNDVFDGIFCHHVLEHLEEPEKALNEFFRVIKDGGIVIVEVPSKWDPNAYRDSTHKQFFTIESLSRIFEESGFKILSGYYCALEIKSIKNRFLYEILKLVGRGLVKIIKKRRRAIRIYAQKIKKGAASEILASIFKKRRNIKSHN